MAISRHVEDCPHCTRELAQLEAYLADLAPDAALGRMEQVKILIAELVRGVQGLGQTPAFAPAPAFAGLRGEEEEPLVYQAERYQIVIEVARDGQQPDRYALMALVTGPEIDGLEARLEGTGGSAATAPVDELGNLYFSAVSPGSYALYLSGSQIEIEIPGLKIGEA
jgi:hypothetical protein